MSLVDRPFLAAVNHLLGQARWARERLMAFAGSHVRLRAEPVDMVFGIDGHGLLCARGADARPDVELSFPLSELPRVLGEGSARLMNAVRIEGSAELADAVGFVFRNLRWDAEEDLSRVLGDIPARRLVMGAEALHGAHERAVRALGANFAEYLSEEQPLLVSSGALPAFADDLRALRDAIARLDKRAERLERQPRGKRSGGRPPRASRESGPA